MADPAQEEAERYLSSREHHTSHPEDRGNSSDHSDAEDEKHVPQQTNSDPDTDDDDVAANMATMTQTRTQSNAFHLPTTAHYANTGPKGVIADAQSFQRAKQSTFRDRFANFTNQFRSSEKQQASKSTQSRTGSSSPRSDVALSEEDSDSEFMTQWRAARLQELQAQADGKAQRRVSPSRRIWGTLQEVDANGYLDAIEKVSPEDVVVVLIFDPTSTQSKEVEDELGMLAYKYNTTRFVKLDSDTAEMKEIDVPAVLVYKDGDVFATVSGAKADGLEGVLKKHRALG